MQLTNNILLGDFVLVNYDNGGVLKVHVFLLPITVRLPVLVVGSDHNLTFAYINSITSPCY